MLSRRRSFGFFTPSTPTAGVTKPQDATSLHDNLVLSFMQISIKIRIYIFVTV